MTNTVIKTISSILVVFLFFLSSCTKVPQVSSIKINLESATLKVNETLSLSVTILPEEAKQTPIIWASSNENIAIVKSGKVLAKNPGEAIITATTEDGGHTATCRVVVIIPVESLRLNHTACTINIGETLQLEATITPDNASNKNITWESSDESIASIHDGEVKAINGGTAIISAISEESGMSASCEVTVWVPVTSISIEKKYYFASFGDEIIINPTILPENASNKNFYWSFSSPDIIEDVDGRIKAKKSGYVSLTAISEDGEKQASTSLRVFGTGIKDGYPYADLGLSVMWATYNVGTNTPHGWGDRFAWGETTPKEDYTWANYKFMKEGYADRNYITKYTQDDGRWSIDGIWWDDDWNFIGDGITQLEPEDDAAIVHWGGNWKMPTSSEMIELYNNCYFSLVDTEDLHGYIYTSKINGESIFFPFIGDPVEWYPKGVRYFGYYWSSTLYYYPFFAYSSEISYYETNNFTWIGWTYQERYQGFAIRPVIVL